jgi:hypothetical protein
MKGVGHRQSGAYHPAQEEMREHATAFAVDAKTLATILLRRLGELTPLEQMVTLRADHRARNYVNEMRRRGGDGDE